MTEELRQALEADAEDAGIEELEAAAAILARTQSDHQLGAARAAVTAWRNEQDITDAMQILEDAVSAE